MVARMDVRLWPLQKIDSSPARNMECGISRDGYLGIYVDSVDMTHPSSESCLLEALLREFPSTSLK